MQRSLNKIWSTATANKVIHGRYDYNILICDWREVVIKRFGETDFMGKNEFQRRQIEVISGVKRENFRE